MRRLFFSSLVLVTLLLSNLCLAEGKDPVIFIHGIGGSASSFSAMVNYFADRGYKKATNIFGGTVYNDTSFPTDTELFCFEWNTFTTPIPTAAQNLKNFINQKLAQTGKTKVDIVTHSAGSLPARWYLKFVDNTKVDALVAIASANHGALGWNWAGCNVYSYACSAANPNGAIVANLNHHSVNPAERPHWTGPGYSEETPRDPADPAYPRYMTVRSLEDTNATPASSAILSGADENFLTDCCTNSDNCCEPIQLDNGDIVTCQDDNCLVPFSCVNTYLPDDGYSECSDHPELHGVTRCCGSQNLYPLCAKGAAGLNHLQLRDGTGGTAVFQYYLDFAYMHNFVSGYLK